jgi:GGDEF domain-containing protein
MTAGTQHPQVFGLRRSAVIEIALYLAATIALDYFFLDGSRYRDVSPHPFWPIVVLIAVQYGTGEALLAATATSVALLAGNLPEQSISQDSYDYLVLLVREPVMWFVAAIVVGELRMRHVHERNQLQHDLSAALKREEDISAAYRRVSSLKDNLEARVAGQVRTAITMYEAVRSMERHDPNEVLLGVMDIVRAVMNPDKFSLYLLREDVLEISIGEGWTSEDSLSRVFRTDSRLFQEVIGRQRVVCAVNPEDERVLAKEGVLAGPLMDRETGSVIGMLKIERMGFFELHFSNVQTFRVLCDWIADAYVNARRFQIAESESFLNSKTHLYSYAFFERQTQYVQHLARRIGFDLSILFLRIENDSDLTEQKRLSIPPAINSAVAKVLRQTDLAFDYRRGGYQFCLILPNTPERHARLVGDRLVAELAGLIPEARFVYAVQGFERGEPVENSA